MSDDRDDAASTGAEPKGDAEIETWLRRACRTDDVAAPLVSGMILDNGYRILSRVGEGGMGVVYLAERLQDGSRVAVKQIRSVVDAEHAVRFVREAVAPSLIDSPHVVRVLDRALLRPNGAYLVMEYLEGQTLEQAISEGAPFTLERSVHVATQVASCLVAVHDAGVVHRDLKPANILLVEQDGSRDFVKVIDFGIAKSNRASSTLGVALTNTGVRLGTVAYMSPEQVRGDRDVDARTDVYALGMLFAEMLTGRLPYGGKSLEARLQDLESEKVALPRALRPELPEAVDLLVQRAVAHQKHERYPNSVALLQSLIALAPVSLER
jgi:serine/threonine protein kinase